MNLHCSKILHAEGPLQQLHNHLELAAFAGLSIVGDADRRGWRIRIQMVHFRFVHVDGRSGHGGQQEESTNGSVTHVNGYITVTRGDTMKQKNWFNPGSNWEPSVCETEIITIRPLNLLSWEGFFPSRQSQWRVIKLEE